MTQQIPQGKYRDNQIQVKMYEALNPSTTPGDMLHPWTPGNSRNNQDMAQFILAIQLLTEDWSDEYYAYLTWFIPRLTELYIDMDAFARVQAIEALGKQSIIGTPESEKPKKSLLDRIRGK